MKAIFRKILIISDNALLCRQFIGIIEKKHFTQTVFSFAISPFSNLSLFKFPGIETVVYNLRDQSAVDLIKANFDLVISIHCKQIFPEDLVSNVRCINVHPGYNPINRGWYPQVFSIINHTEVGATIHEIDGKLDHGTIICRAYVPKFSYDTSETLYNRIVEKELQLLDENLHAIVNNTYETTPPENEGKLFLKKDFDDLLAIDLDAQMRVGDVIDKLRALTHGHFNNAYFIDSETGQKIFVGITLKPESNE